MTTEREMLEFAAKDAGFNPSYLGGYVLGEQEIERFYSIAFDAGRQAEREECAKVCESIKSNWNYCAEAIRARSTK